MPFVTPNGLKILLDERPAFEAMGEATSGEPIDILRATEWFALAPSVLSLIAGIAGFGFGLEGWAIVSLMSMAIAVPRVLYTWIPGFLFLISITMNPFIRVFIGITIGYFARGWTGSFIFLVGVAIASLATALLMLIYIPIFGFSRSERSFFLACLHHGVPQAVVDQITNE